ncbi:MAG: YezD family protein [Butyrivibrio sp.]|nr:YezD family protein [Butyrivibrio sp.]
MAEKIIKNQKINDDTAIWKELKKQVDNIDYGSVLITIHDGRIVQLESSLKIRF